MAEESSSTKKVFLKKDQREACWKARDTFWKCMNTNEQDGYSISILVYRRKKIEFKNNHLFVYNFRAKCMEERKPFEELCPQQWVTHFDRKYRYDQFKIQAFSKGHEKMDEEFFKKAKSI